MARFVTAEVGEELGVAGEVFGFEGRFLAVHFVVQGGGLDVPDAELPPSGGGDSSTRS